MEAAPAAASALAVAAAPAAVSPVRREPPRGDGQTCPACGSNNPPGTHFCKMCGAGLSGGRMVGGGGAAAAASGVIAPAAVSAQAPAQAPVAQAPVAAALAAAAARITCASCGKPTPGGFAFCQHCGHRLTPQAGQAPSVATPAAVPQPMPVLPTPPAGLRGPAPQAVAPVSHGQPAAAPAFAAPGARPPVTASPGLGRLIAVRRDGSDGDVIPLTGETFDIGRSEGSLCFSEDPFLAPRHARFLVYGGVVKVRPLDLVNGVFLRLRDPHDLQSGDLLYLGKELLRYEALAVEERDPPAMTEHGVRLFGSSPRESWGRLRQVTGAGTTRDLWHLSRAEVVLGREEGDIIFPDDEFMSRRHATLSRTSGRARISDLNSSNGTYLRLRGERELRPSDVLRMGDQLLRYEP